MKKHMSAVIVILMVLTGLSLLLYPTVSDYLKGVAFRRTISHYTASAQRLEEGEQEEMLRAAQAYNERLAAEGWFMLNLSQAQQTEYNSLLDIDSTGVMGYVSVPKVDISLPIYHGTGDGALQNGVGHMESTSLPVGGPSTHAVLSAHTGMPSAKLFTNIDQLVEGDTFTVGVLRETLTYQVDQILVVLPHEVDALAIEPGEDYCTLMTCTPYGINSHRLLVRGHRIPTPADAQAPTGASRDTGWTWVIPAAIILLALAALLVVRYLRRRIQRQKHPERKETTTPKAPKP